MRAREAELGEKLYERERAEIGAEAPLAIAPEVGVIPDTLTITERPGLIVEFGGSLGLSTRYLAAALKDLDSGELVSTELIETRAQAAAQNLADAGVASRVSIRPGDARETLANLNRLVDMLFLDGSNDLYLDILTQLEPQLGDHAVVAADLSYGDPHHDRYRDYVAAPDNGYLSVTIPIDAGLVVANRANPCP